VDTLRFWREQLRLGPTLLIGLAGGVVGFVLALAVTQ
jgi:hypothetical protein